MGSNIRNGLVVLHVFGVVAETHATWYGEDGVGG